MGQLSRFSVPNGTIKPILSGFYRNFCKPFIEILLPCRLVILKDEIASALTLLAMTGRGKFAMTI